MDDITAVETSVRNLRTFLSKEHNDDGTHADVTAESITLQGAAVGEVVNLPFDASRFTALAATWTVGSGDVKYFRASRVGQLVTLEFNIRHTAITVDTPDQLYINIPEFHAIPAVDEDEGDIAIGHPAGVCYWRITDDPDLTTRSGIGIITIIADDFISDVPATVLILERFGSGTGLGTAEAMFAQWPESSDFFVSGSVTFMVQENNVPTPFFGS